MPTLSLCPNEDDVTTTRVLPLACRECGKPTRVMTTQAPRNEGAEVVPGVQGIERRRVCTACGAIDRTDEVWHADLANMAQLVRDEAVASERRRLGRLVGGS